MPGPDPFSVFFDVLVADRVIGELMRVALADSEVSALEYAVLSVAHEEPGVTATAMATRMGAPLTTVTDWLAKPLRRGHLVRHRLVSDGRAWGLQLTPLGERVFEDARRAFAHAYERYLGHPGVDASAQHRMLLAMCEAVQQVTLALQDEREASASEVRAADR